MGGLPRYQEDMQYDEAEAEVRGGVAQPRRTRLIYTGLLPCKQSTLTRVEAACYSTYALQK